ncbi:MAG: class II aldolase/adducin family protein [Bacteroidales bacterium]|nr:class II aldolase/adducin family protein [Bacteroidales bacterium]
MSEKEIRQIRKEVACFMRRLYDRGLTTASGGNISYRVEQGFFITPSALDKALIKPKQIGMITLKGKNLTPDLKPSMEVEMHQAIYQKRADVQAIVHAHPPVASSFTAMKKEINCSLIAEARAMLGTPVIAPYALMGTRELAEAVSDAAATNQNTGKNNDREKSQVFPNVILLENHGIVCLGKDLLSAFDRLEVVEAAAKMTLITGLMDSVSPLNSEQLNQIDRLMGI